MGLQGLQYSVLGSRKCGQVNSISGRGNAPCPMYWFGVRSHSHSFSFMRSLLAAFGWHPSSLEMCVLAPSGASVSAQCSPLMSSVLLWR